MHDTTYDIGATLDAVDQAIARIGNTAALETKSRQPAAAAQPAPASSADPLDRLVNAIDRQTAQLETRSAVPAPPARGGSDRAPATVRAPVEKQRALGELRSASETLARARRIDPLIEEKQRRINADMDAHDASEVARLRRENAELRRKNARPPAQRAGGQGGTSEKNAAFALYRKAIDQYMRTGQETFGGRSLKEIQAQCLRLDQKAFNGTVSADGGYFVQPEQDSGPIERLLTDLSPMRRLATVRSISSASFKTRVNLGGQGARWVGETTATSTDATPQFAELEYPAKTLIAEPEATSESLEDSAIDPEQLLSEEAQYEFAESESAAFVGGSGVNSPKGFLAYDFVANASWVHGKIGYLATGADGAFASTGPADVVLKLPLELRAMYRNQGSWLMNRGTIGTVRTLRGSDGHYLWKEGDVSKSVPNTLAGFVVEEDDFMPVIGSGAHAMAFGAWAQGYLIVDRVGFSVLRNPYINPPYVRFHMRKRVGGGVKMFDAIKTIKFSAS